MKKIKYYMGILSLLMHEHVLNIFNSGSSLIADPVQMCYSGAMPKETDMKEWTCYMTNGK